MGMSVCGFVHGSPGQQRVFSPPGLELGEVMNHMMWVLGSKVHYIMTSVELVSKLKTIYFPSLFFSLSVSKNLRKLRLPYHLSAIELLADFSC